MKERLVSVCMIVKDEEALIRRAIESTFGLADEVVVVDTGSNDQTVAIARSLGARVFKEPWRDDFAAARNASIERARYPWIVVLDADEAFAPGDAPRLRRLLRRAPDAISGYSVYQTNLRGLDDPTVMDKGSTFRVFRNTPRHRYLYPIHEQIVDALGDGVLGKSDIELLHVGFDDALVTSRGKRERNMRILRSLLDQLPASHGHRYYVTYQLGVESLRAMDNIGALGWFAQSFSGLSRTHKIPANRGYVNSMVMLYAHTLNHLGRAAEAERVAQAAIDLGIAEASVWFMRGCARLRMGRLGDGTADLLWSIALAERSATTADMVSQTHMEQAWEFAIQALVQHGSLPAAAAVAVHALSRCQSDTKLLALATALAETSADLRTFIAARVPMPVLFPLAQKAVQERRLATAEAAATRLLASGDRHGVMVLACCALADDRAAVAVRLLESIPDGDPARAEAALLLGIARRRLGFPPQAVLASLRDVPSEAARAAYGEALGGPAAPADAEAERWRRSAGAALAAVGLSVAPQGAGRAVVR